MRKRKINLTKEEVEDWLKQDKTITALAKEIGVTKSAMATYVRKMGIKVKSGRKPGFHFSDEMKKLYSDLFSGVNNPFYGKTHPPETRKRMSENHADFKGDKNPYKKALDADPEKRIIASKRSSDMWKNLSDDEYALRREHCSEGQAKSTKVKKMPNSKSGYFTGKKCGKVFYRSSWELEFCEYLEKDKSVKEFGLEKFFIKYIDGEGIIRSNRTDFSIVFKNEKRMLVEVKPEKLLTIGLNPYKIAGQRKYCKNNNWLFGILSSTDKKDMDDIIKLARD
jgi:hypothetical protein